MSVEQHVKTEDPLFGWTATDRPLELPPDNLDPASSTGTSINVFVRGVGVGLTHTKNLMIKKLREVRETNGLELGEEEAEPTIGRIFKTKFEIPNENSENILITDSDFILSDRTSAIDLHDGGHELQIETGGRLQERMPERGVSIQTETGDGRNGCASPISGTSPRQIPVLSSDEGQ